MANQGGVAELSARGRGDPEDISLTPAAPTCITSVITEWRKITHMLPESSVFSGITSRGAFGGGWGQHGQARDIHSSCHYTYSCWDINHVPHISLLAYLLYVEQKSSQSPEQRASYVQVDSRAIN